MKTFVSIIAFIISWTMITFFAAFAISLVFNLSYTSVIYFPVFIVVSLLGTTIIAGNIANEVYDHLAEREIWS